MATSSAVARTASTWTSRSTASVHEDHRSQRIHDRGHPSEHDRVLGVRETPRRVRFAGSRPDEDVTYDGEPARPQRRGASDQIRHHRSKTFKEQKLFTDIFPGRTRGSQDPHLRQGRQPRGGHRRDRSTRSSARGNELLPEDHLQGDRRQEARRSDPGVSQRATTRVSP